MARSSRPKGMGTPEGGTTGAPEGGSVGGAGAPPGPAPRADSARRRLRPGVGVASFVAGGLAVTLASVPIVLGLMVVGSAERPTTVFEQCEHEDLTATGPDGGPVRTGLCVQHALRDPILGVHLDQLRLVVRQEDGTEIPRAVTYGWPLRRDAQPEVVFGSDTVTVSDGHVTATFPRVSAEDLG